MSVVIREKIDTSNASNAVSLPRSERATPEFRLMYHPGHWTWTGKEYGWLPDLGRLVMDPGVQGVPDKVPGRALDTSRARAHWQGKGWTVIDHLSPVLGPHKEYLAKWRGERGAIWTTAYSTPEIIGSQVFWDFDREGYYKFLKYLVDNRVLGIEPMDSRLKGRHLRNLQRQVDQRVLPQLTQHPDSAALKARYEKLTAEINDIKADIEKSTKKSVDFKEPVKSSKMGAYRDASDDVEGANG